jgi:gamma-glutamyltranspeptidase/glutathione hydrolase
MNLFNPQPGNANSIAPWKRPASSMAHFIVLRDGQPLLITGAPGGRRIMDTVLQVTLNVLDFGMGIQEAVSAPLMDATGPETYVDPRIPEPVRAELAAMGHALDVRARDFWPGHYARPAGITRDAGTGELRGGADPYDIGVAAGF